MLPCLVDKELPGISIIPPGVKKERDWRPRWLDDYSYSNLNSETLYIDVLSNVQYGRVLDRIIGEVVIAHTALGPVYVLKADVNGGF